VYPIERLTGDETLEGLYAKPELTHGERALKTAPRVLSRDKCRSAVYSGP
jgi:hypothetical protein